MARIARIVVAGVPHHITQRGSRCQRTFFQDGDYALYLSLLGEWCSASGVAIWAYCLMPNHVHLVAVPESAEGLRRGIGEAHRRYTRAINFREGWRGHLWQGRFASFVMDEKHLMLAVRYVELNPVRAKLCRAPWRWPWSSAPAHVAGRDDELVRVGPLSERVDDWRAFLLEGLRTEDAEILRRHERTGRPLGETSFLERIEQSLGRVVRPNRRGPKPKRPSSQVWCPEWRSVKPHIGFFYEYWRFRAPIEEITSKGTSRRLFAARPYTAVHTRTLVYRGVCYPQIP